MSNAPRRNPVAAFFVGVWDVMNFTRRLIMNLVFFGVLLILLLILLAARGREGAETLQSRTTLVIAPEGSLVEQYSHDPASRALAKIAGRSGAEEVQLRDLLRALKAARTDKRIERVYLDVDKLGASGFASLREVAAALADLRAAGKPIVAFSQGMEQKQYLLDAQANEVYLDPMGSVLLEGLSDYRQYFRTALQDKLGVQVHLFRVGEYKSAAEPYILDAASKEAKEADLFWMGDIWQRYLGDIAKARKLDPAQLAANIDALPDGVDAAKGDLAQYAVQQKLVDGLKTEEEVEDLLAQRGVKDKDSDYGFRSVELNDYLADIDRAKALDTRPQVAIVVASGEISGGEKPAGQIGGESTAALLRQARDDDDVKAVVLRVDSPGGEVFASEQIRREVVKLKEAHKPVIVSMGDVAASGGYWIGMNADRIYADASTISGSIGIFGLLPDISGTLDKFGVHTDGVATTKYAGAFDISRPLDPEVGRVMQATIDKGYADFTGKVAAARGKGVEQIDEIARGRVWSGAQAQARGLVDQLGSLDDAIGDAAQRARLGKGKFRVSYVEKAATPLQQFLGGFANSEVGSLWLRKSGLAEVLLRDALPQMDSQLRFVESAMQHRAGAPVAEVAHCFCGL